MTIVKSTDATITTKQQVNVKRGEQQAAPCRFCGAPITHTFADLGMSPLANSYVPVAKANAMEPFYPLHAYVCTQCWLVQLQMYETGEHIFSEYAYFSSFSDSWLAHAKAYTDKMRASFGLNASSQVIEIASNDGYLLQYFKEAGVPVLGVEPAKNVAEAAVAKGIPSVVKFFGETTARELVGEGMLADLLLGNNVLAHVPGLNDFVKGMKILLKPTGVITMEFPHLQRLVDECQFDTIYHEHFSYFSFITVEQVFAKHGLTLFDVEELPTHGGSLRIYARHSEDGTKPVSEKVMALRAREKQLGYAGLELYNSFAGKVIATKRNILEFLIGSKRAGKMIVGYGAPAKGNTLLNYCGIRNDMISYTVDRSPHKQDHFLPGTRIPIYGPEKITETKPDYVVILPWNLKNEIIKQMSHIREWGGKFVVFIPEVQVIA
jgi:2-polyprenyl-3-methyl-5-hydroxy-6-metoxy-1,4-benzoquinol methylase